MTWLANILGAKNQQSARFDYPFFRDTDIQKQIAKNGYSVQPLLDKNDIERLIDGFNKTIAMLPEPMPDTHWTSGRVEDTRIRNFARHAIHEIIPARLEKYFDPATTDFIGGIFVAKKPSPISKLTSHQDSSHTDERKYPAVYAWIALTDTTVETGAMHVLPGSHLWGNRYRSLNVPWLFDGLQDQMQAMLVPVPMKAGEVLFFDSAAIHYSSDNLGAKVRPAINFFIKPKEAKFLHHFIDEKTPSGMVEVYNVDIDFFYNCDFMQRPPAPYTFLGYEPYDLKKPDSIKSNSLFSRIF